jgi:plasmid stabilization system protein ParE
MHRHTLLPKAQEEYEAAFTWYSERSEKATLNFVARVEEAIRLICEQPYQFKSLYKDFHEINTKNYPFTLVYTIDEKTKMVIIYSVHQNNRNPKKKFKAAKIRK